MNFTQKILLIAKLAMYTTDLVLTWTSTEKILNLQEKCGDYDSFKYIAIEDCSQQLFPCYYYSAKELTNQQIEDYSCYLDPGLVDINPTSKIQSLKYLYYILIALITLVKLTLINFDCKQQTKSRKIRREVVYNIWLLFFLQGILNVELFKGLNMICVDNCKTMQDENIQLYKFVFKIQYIYQPIGLLSLIAVYELFKKKFSQQQQKWLFIIVYAINSCIMAVTSGILFFKYRNIGGYEISQKISIIMIIGQTLLSYLSVFNLRKKKEDQLVEEEEEQEK